MNKRHQVNVLEGLKYWLEDMKHDSEYNITQTSIAPFVWVSYSAYTNTIRLYNELTKKMIYEGNEDVIAYERLNEGGFLWQKLIVYEGTVLKVYQVKDQLFLKYPEALLVSGSETKIESVYVYLMKGTTFQTGTTTLDRPCYGSIKEILKVELMQKEVHLEDVICIIKEMCKEYHDGTTDDIDLSGLDLRKVDFQHPELKRLNFEGVNLENANLEGVDLSGHSIITHQLKKITSDYLLSINKLLGIDSAEEVLSEKVDRLLEHSGLLDLKSEQIIKGNKSNKTAYYSVHGYKKRL